MTNDAPERISVWAYPFTGRLDEGRWHSFDPKAYVGGCTEYIRKDVSDAAVAAEREACAKAVEERAAIARSKPDWCITAPVCEAEALRCASRIRSRANTDALERVKQEAKAEALREAAEE